MGETQQIPLDKQAMDTNELFRSQYGLISRAQALAQGMSERQIDHRQGQGAWLRVHRSVYRLASHAESWEGRLLAAALATDGIASHRCAAALWDLEIYQTPEVEVTIPHRSWSTRHVFRIHHTTQWELRDETVRRGIRCSGIERTVLDCGAVMSVRTLERVAEAAIRKQHTSWQSLGRTLYRHSRHGRSGCGTLRVLLDERLGTPEIPLSDFSRRVVNLLRLHGLPQPVIEYRITDDDGDFIMQTDLAWPGLRKAWELDGLQFHFGRTDIERDRRKRNRARSIGWTIQEILWSMYRDEPDRLVAMARTFLTQHR